MITATDKQYFGRAGVNYFTTPGFENGNGDWSKFTTAFVSNVPTTITPGAANITLPTSLLGSGGLRGTIGLPITYTAATAGQGLITNTLTIDVADRAKVLTLSFEYQVESGTFNGSGTSTQSVEVWIYDVTNSTWIQPAGYRGMNQTSGVGILQCTFQTSSNSTQYRAALIVRNIVTCTINFDTFSFGPQSTVQGAAISDWASFTPTISTSTGAVSNATPTGLWRRVGSDLEVVGSITFSAASSAFTDILVTVPSGISIDTTKTLANKVGYATSYDNGVSFFLADVLTNNASRVLIYGVDASVSRAALTNITNLNPFTFNANDTITFSYKVPVVGWSSNTVMSNDTDTRVIATRATAALPTGTIASTFAGSTAVIFSGTSYDLSGSYSTSTGVFTVPVSGVYKISASTRMSGTLAAGSSFSVIAITKNGVEYSNVGLTFSTSTGAGTLNSFGSDAVSCIAGDLITIRVVSNATTPIFTSDSTKNFLEISRLSGPATIAASETVAASYGTSAAPSIPNNSATIVVYPTKQFDTHGMMNTSTGVVTIPVSGKYLISAGHYFGSSIAATATDVQTLCRKNGTTVQGTNVPKSGTSAGPLATQGTFLVQCLAGDTIGIYLLQSNSASTAQALLASAEFNYMTITRVGN